jgi:hypothetical protein
MYKSKILLIIPFFILLFSLSAQSQMNFSVGAKTGYLFSTYKFNYPSLQYQMRRGMTGGVYLRYVKNNKFIFEPGIQISSKGTIQSAFDTLDRTEFVATYVDIPILIGIQPSPEFFQIKAGIQFSNILSAYSRSNDSNTEFKEFYNRWDIAAVIDVSYEFDFGLNVGARMCNGMSNLRRESNFIPNTRFSDDLRSFNMQILVGYTLPLIVKDY